MVGASVAGPLDHRRVVRFRPAPNVEAFPAVSGHDRCLRGRGDVDAGVDGTVDEAQDEGIEMQSLLPNTGREDPSHDAQGLNVTIGRPNVKAIVGETFERGRNESVAVFVCGPVGLTRSVRKEVGRYVREGRDVWFWSEAFGL